MARRVEESQALCSGVMKSSGRSWCSSNMASLRASVSLRICLNRSSFSGYLMKISIAIRAARAGNSPMVALMAMIADSGWTGLGFAALAAMYPPIARAHAPTAPPMD